MGFTIEMIKKVSFEPCVGWPKEVGYTDLPVNTDKFVVVNGHLESSLTGELKLDNFTGYVTIESWQQGGMTGCESDRVEKRTEIVTNSQMVLSAFEDYKNNR